jgi:hypothetical protein
MWLRYFLNDFEMVPVAPIITGITFVFTFHMHCNCIVRFLYFRISQLISWPHFCLLELQHLLTQWYSTWGTRTLGGTRRHFRGYVKLKKYILFHDKHWIIRARFRVSHNWPGRKDMRFGSAIFFSLSLTLLYAILIWAASFILFHIVHIIYLLFNSLTLLFLI